jgi:genome maintenance exonuclease 1
MKKFRYELFEPKTLQRINEEGKRLYVTESGEKYTSVTTALSYFSRKGIAIWRSRVGDAEANRISRQASAAGTAMHDIAEHYMLGTLDEEKMNPIAWSNFKTIKPHLDENVEIIYGVELQMYSDQLKAAGTADLICQYDGKNTILDFKTSKKKKTRSQIKTYFMQGAAYADMVEQHYGLKIDQIVILMAVHGSPDPVVFIEPIGEWSEMTRKFFQLYNEGKLA